MYLVDSNDDGFELRNEEIKELVSKGIIKIVGEQQGNCHQPINDNCKDNPRNLGKSVKYK
jgi:hypothetical protein